jgi:ABC-2 type transport system permease protein
LPAVFREAQAAGTLEAMMLSHFGVYRLLVYSTAFPALLNFGKLVVYALVAVLVLGLWHDATVPAAAAVFVAALLAHGALGVMSCAFVIVWKRGDPVLLAYRALSALFAGVIFPRELLPDWLQWLSLLLPLTYALEGMRKALGGAAFIDVLFPDVVVLFALFVALLPLTVWLTRWAIRRAKEEAHLCSTERNGRSSPGPAR